MTDVNLTAGVGVAYYYDVAGASAQWSDGSDATWASTRSYMSAVGTQRNTTAGLNLNQYGGTIDSTGRIDISIRVSVTAPAEAGATVPLSWGAFPSTSLYPSPRPNGYWTVSTDGAIHDYATTIYNSTLLSAFAAQSVEFDIGFHVLDPGGTDYGASLPTPSGYVYEAVVYELSVVVQDSAAPAFTPAPPLRQWPRSDGLGASSARRLWPLSPSIQASNRKVGGYL